MSTVSENYALIGAPNCGKTTLFNLLTGARQAVGNWPGVTVERKEGRLPLAGHSARLIDLPGLYSLSADEDGIDQQVARQYLSQNDIKAIINVVDATQLQRQLLLTAQLQQFNLPIILVVNMLDVAEQQHLAVDLSRLSENTGMRVVGLCAAKQTGLSELKHVLSDIKQATAIRHTSSVSPLELSAGWLKGVITAPEQPDKSLSERMDQWILHPLFGILIFLIMMYLMFSVAINLGSVFIDAFDIIAGMLFIDTPGYVMQTLNAPVWLTSILTDGVGGGLQMLATFIPVIAFLYLALSLLESSGYMARAAFVVDRLMAAIGLPGKAFVPLIVGFGCNVPAVMATRTLSHRRDRMVTIAMAPFMSCGARLAVYTLFAAAVFHEHGQNVVFALYLIGILMAILSGWMFRRFFPDSDNSISVMEMPAYHLPRWRNIAMQTWHRLSTFIKRAGKTIVVMYALLTIVGSYQPGENDTQSESSLMEMAGKSITPLFAPMGIKEDNWPAIVGILTGVFAKEAVVGTLDALYSKQQTSAESSVIQAPDFIESSSLALGSIHDNLIALGDNLLDPLGIQIKDYASPSQASEAVGVEQSSLNQIAARFGSTLAAFSYLVFILLYTPCLAMISTLIREAGGAWALVIGAWTTILAYSSGTLCYQLGTYREHPLQSLAWLSVIAGILWLTRNLLYLLTQRAQTSQAGRIPLIQLS